MEHSRKYNGRSMNGGRRKVTESSTFLKRSLTLQAELQKKSYPNASTLATMCGCSRSTAMRTIDRLRYEFGVPIEYDESNRGYFLTKPDFSFASLPPGRDELVALVLLSEMALMIDDPSLHDALNSLWARITNGRGDIDHDLEHMRQRFSSETTSVAKLADIDLVRLLTLCHRGQPTLVRYRSPWRHDEDKEYGGLFDRLHFSDGMLYALFKESGGRELILNVSFIKEIREVSELPPVAKEDGEEIPSKPYWLEGFGIWSGSKPETIEITIAPPASRFYAAQVWHIDQEDIWVGERLVRRFPGIASPELTRRVLSLGRFVVSVRPEFILEQMREDVDHLSSLCGSEISSRE
jgi:predicted DNA-binding transcriptional regulator YafY